MRTDVADKKWWQPWSALTLFFFLLHFLWEMLQVPLYEGMASAPHWQAIRVCFTATVGDVAIALIAYLSVAIGADDRQWLARPSAMRVASYVAVGLAITVVLEFLNVYVWRRWGYASAMPLVLGFGVSPLVQWIAVPVMALWLARRHMASAP